MKIPILKIPFSDDDIKTVSEGVAKVLQSGMLAMSGTVRAFEDRFADFCGVPHAVGVNSGTSALEIIFRCLDVSGGTVLVPSNTFMATAMAAVKAGARVVFCDCQKDNLQIDPDEVQNKIRSDTKAVVVVHVGGIISPEFDRIVRICRERGISVVEDAAHAHGSKLNGRPAGSLARAGAFSFFPTKVLTTAEGGMITTNYNQLVKSARILRDHGKDPELGNRHSMIGDNWRFSELHAVLGLALMEKADWIVAERRRIAAWYDELTAGIDGFKPVRIPAEVESSYYKYICLMDEGLDRAVIKARMRDEFGVALTGEVYAEPCHVQPVFDNNPELLANNPGDEFPNTDWVSKNHLCLPLYPGLSREDVEYVVDSLKRVL